MNHALPAMAALLCGSALVVAAPATNLSGDWQINATAGTTPIIIDCTLAQTRDALTGQCAPRSEDATWVELTGTTGAKSANWGYAVVFRGNPGTVAFEANTISALRMKGTLKLNGRPSAFSATKLGVEERLQRLQDESEIRALLQDYMGLLTARDWDNYVKLFSANSDLVMTEGTVHGREAIRTRMANATERMAKAAAAANRPARRRADLLTNVQLRVTGDIAQASSRFTFLSENDAHELVVAGSGRYLDALIREDGRWRIRRRTVDYDLLAGAPR
jgi:3-phenylpropionate/cinnamic acid dioxygenase small subunit